MEANNMSTIVLLEMQVKPEAVDEMKAFLKKAHSIGFRGGVCPRSSKASRRKDLQIE
jgi:hypothetical protein